MQPHVMTLNEFRLVSHLMYVLDRECARGLKEGPWLSRVNSDVYVLLPTGRIVTTNSFTAALYARDCAWEGVEFAQEVYDWCENVNLRPQPKPLPVGILGNRSAGSVMQVEWPV